MSKNTDILFDLIEIWANENELYSKQAKVVSVDVDAKTCVVAPSDGGPNILDVRLEADEDTDNKGFFVVPAVDSLVGITFMSKEESFISVWTSIDKVIAKQGLWQFNKGENGGLTITPELKSQLDTTNSLLQALIDIISGAPINEPGNGAPSALQAALAAAISGEELGDYSGIENEDVVH
jgi:hypothetical protein